MRFSIACLFVCFVCAISLVQGQMMMTFAAEPDTMVGDDSVEPHTFEQMGGAAGFGGGFGGGLGIAVPIGGKKIHTNIKNGEKIDKSRDDYSILYLAVLI